ncbi:MAG TPA: DUF1657 domain-containing protein [Limnochordia bacterium]|nr:DUF1657 domain-containing protein [Limnochordia bacterium]
MTVKTRLEKTIADAESLSSQLKNHALETGHPDVSEMFTSMSQKIEEILPRLKGRLEHVKDEEPQYR